MGSFLVSLILFVVFFSLFSFAISNIFLPLFVTIPYVKRYRKDLPIKKFLVAPISWLILLSIVFLLVYLFLRSKLLLITVYLGISAFLTLIKVISNYQSVLLEAIESVNRLYGESDENNVKEELRKE